MKTQKKEQQKQIQKFKKPPPPIFGKKAKMKDAEIKINKKSAEIKINKSATDLKSHSDQGLQKVSEAYFSKYWSQKVSE